jgi:hypothetical protein
MLTFKEILAQAEKDKKKKKTDSGGEPTDVVVNPVKDDRAKSQQSESVDPCWKGYKMVGMKKKSGSEVPNCVPVKEENELSEAVVSLAVRIKRAQNMRKYRSRLMRGKKLAQARLATGGKLKTKTRSLARRTVKKQTVGSRGWEYQKLSAADKIAIDKMMDRKLAAVKQVAARLAPKVRQAEVKRYANRSSGRTGRGTLSYVGK